jgi:hypothetical protein
MNFRFSNRAGSLAIVMALTLAAVTRIDAQDSGGLGSVSTCPSAPQISAVATSFALAPQSGLNLSQANAAVHTIVQQAVKSAPNLAPQIAQQAIATITQTAEITAKNSQASHNGVSVQELLDTPAHVAVSATAGYSAAVQSVVQGTIQGCSSSGMIQSDLKNIISAIASTIVTEAAKQAGVTAATTQNGAVPAAEKSLPMDNAQNSVAVIKDVVASVTQQASALGIPPAEIATSINDAGQDAKAVAQNIGTDVVAAAVSRQTAGQVASQVAAQVAQQVAAQVAQQVASQVAAQVNQVTKDTQKAVEQSQSANPGSQNSPSTVPTAPGQSVNPGNGTPPTILQPNPTPIPRSSPPQPTPTPTSGRG